MWSLTNAGPFLDHVRGWFCISEYFYNWKNTDVLLTLCFENPWLPKMFLGEVLAASNIYVDVSTRLVPSWILWGHGFISEQFYDWKNTDMLLTLFFEKPWLPKTFLEKWLQCSGTLLHRYVCSGEDANTGHAILAWVFIFYRLWHE